MTSVHSVAPGQPLVTPPGFLRRFGVYVVGCIMVYLGVGWSEGVTYSSIPEVRWFAALVLSAPPAVLMTGLHFGAQVIARPLLRRVHSLKPFPEAVLLNLPGSLLVAWLLLTSYLAMSARPVFEHFVVRPMPASVRVLQHAGGMINFAEGDRRVIRFEISSADLSELVSHGKFAPTESERTGPEWKRLIWGYTRLDLDFPTPDRIYKRQLPPFQHEDVEEFLFCWSNSPAVVFFRLDK
jgi:hypothetical protein